jgi:hypothetical protein
MPEQAALPQSQDVSCEAISNPNMSLSVDINESSSPLINLAHSYTLAI